jgi:aldehyde dehydrogenase (NAD+)
MLFQIKGHHQNIHKWAKAKRFSITAKFSVKDYIYKDPYGKVLIIAPGYRFSWLLPLVSTLLKSSSHQTF